MKINSEDIMGDIKKSRPNVKEITIKQYITHLNKLKKNFDTDNWDFLSNPDDIMDNIKDKHFTSKRNSLNAIIVLLMALNNKEQYDELIEKYQKLRDELNDKYDEEQTSGKISEKQKKNFASMEEIQEMLKTMQKQIKDDGLKKKEQLKVKDKELLMVYTIFSMLVKYPTRNDMAGMKFITKTAYNQLTDEDKKSGNFLVNQKGKLTFILNQYKTSKKYGEKKIEIDKDIEKILRMYIRLTNKQPGDVLFVSSRNNPLTRNQISQLLLKTSKKYMNKAVSTTLMRKIVVSDKFGDVKKEQAELADIMGHSVATQNKVYVKED
jgi:tetratricopeptide (TPR) repeat protein